MFRCHHEYLHNPERSDRGIWLIHYDDSLGISKSYLPITVQHQFAFICYMYICFK